MGTKTVRKQLGGEKKKYKRTTDRIRSISRLVDQKIVALAKTFLTKQMSVNQSHFRNKAFTNSSLEIFDKVLVLETIMSSYIQEVFPSTSLDESSIEFEFETDRNLYLDMRDTHLSLQLQLFKGRLFDAFKKEKSRT